MSIQHTIRAVHLLSQFFKNDTRPHVVEQWLAAKNPLLGGVSAQQLIERGDEEKLLRFIEGQLGENHSPICRDCRDKKIVQQECIYPGCRGYHLCSCAYQAPL